MSGRGRAALCAFAATLMTAGAMLPLIVFTFVFALAVRRIDASLREALVAFFTAVASAMTGHGHAGFAAPGTFVFALIFLTAFVLYYFVNWKYLSTVWGLS